MTQLPLLTCRSCCVNAAFQGTKQSRLCKAKHRKTLLQDDNMATTLCTKWTRCVSAHSVFLDTRIHESTEDQLNYLLNCPIKLACLNVMTLKTEQYEKAQGCRGDVVNKKTIYMFDWTTLTLSAAAYTQHAYRTNSWSDGCFLFPQSTVSLGPVPVSYNKRSKTENYSGLADHREEKNP